ncbi:MAG: fatty acid desaturase [Gammaproteobacteria bacterium]|nr:fatty acid desaturase [Gammaproteobacteria bacterium]MBV8306922.1 fatty acid desaturase [Gammaproteobacteria bacterium]MBV8404284.1 fatty acid desaturase [Gammaproteobacteria bacterium]
MPETPRSEPQAPLIWSNALMFALTAAAALVLVPWYGLTHGFSGADWGVFVFFLVANGMAITAGYHRLWAHRAYEAHWSLRALYLLFGTMALQNSVFAWCSGHRTHHLHVDDEDRDPYSARRGFWFSHIGWMLREYPSGREDFSNIPDLRKDRLLAFQHRYYVPLAVGLNFGLPLAAGLLFHDVLGMLILAGVLRLVWSHHVTFFINSLAHMWGSRPYTEDNTARDNPVLAVITYGEGYHNFHHIFAHDYRNGVRWWQWDPTKWLIASLQVLGLTRRLKRTPVFQIQRALLAMQFRRAQARLARLPASGAAAHIESLRARVAHEYESFLAALAEWARVKEQRLAEKKRAVLEQWEPARLQRSLREIERRLSRQLRRMRVLQAQLA